MTGALINAALIVMGSTLGVIFSRNTPVGQSTTLVQIIGAFTLLIGIQAARTADTGGKFVIVMAAVLLGGLIGEFLKLEQRAEAWARRLEKTLELKRLSKGRAPRQKELLPALVTSSILFCVGPMAILGSLEDGLKGDPAMLVTKGLMDGTVSIAMAASLGVGVLFSALPVLIYQGGMTLIARQVAEFVTPGTIQSISAVGGVLLLFIGFNMIGVTKIKVLNLLPGLVLGATAANFYWA